MALNPSIDINVRTALSLIPGTGEAVGMLIGTAQYGRIDEVITTSNFTGVLEEFQEDADDNTSITKAAEIFYANGGSILKTVRIADSGALKANKQFAGAGPTANVIKIEAKYKGEFGNAFLIDIDTQGSGRIIKIMAGNIVELFDNNGAANGYTVNNNMATAVNASSKFVTITVNDNTQLVDATANYVQLENGDSGSDGIITADYTTAFDNLIANDDWDILIIPNTSQTISIEDTDAFQTTITGKVNNRASIFKKYGMYISGVTEDEDIATIQARTSSGERLVLCAPSIYHTSRVDGTQEILDGTYLGCALAGKVCDLDDKGNSPTRKEVVVNDLIVDTTTGKKYYNNTEIEQLLSSRVCVASKISNSLRYARGVTRISDTTNIYFEINIVRIVDNIKTTIQNTLEDYLGEPNSTLTRERMQAVTNGILETAQNQGLLNEYLPTVVTEGLSPDTVNVAISIKPAFSTNFINVVIIIS